MPLGAPLQNKINVGMVVVITELQTASQSVL